MKNEEPIELCIVKTSDMDNDAWYRDMAFNCYSECDTVYFKVYDCNTNPNYFLKEHFVKCDIFEPVFGDLGGAFSYTHNAHGPAIIRGNGKVEFWINGKQLMFEDWIEVCELSEKEKALVKLKYEGKQDEHWLAIDKAFEDEKKK